MPGHSLMDWIRLGQSGVDLTGVNGVRHTVTPEQLAAHNTKDDAWIAIRGMSTNLCYKYSTYVSASCYIILNCKSM